MTEKMREDLTSRIVSILSNIIDMNRAFVLYKHSSSDNDKQKYRHQVNTLRATIIEIISYISHDFMLYLQDDLSSLILSNDNNADIINMAISDYGNETLESFCNRIIDQSYVIHNDIVFDIYMRSMNLKFSDIIDSK